MSGARRMLWRTEGFMRKNTLVTLGASIAFGVLSIVLARGWINGAIKDELDSAPSVKAAIFTPPKQATAKILVADVDLNFGDSLSPQSLRMVDMPEDLVPAGSFSNFDALFGEDGKPVAVLSFMGMNEPVLDYKVTGPGGRRALSAMLDEGMRAVSIRVNEVAGVGGFVLPGDHVDILLTRDMSSGQQDSKFQTETLLQNVRVLGTDQNANQGSSQVNVVNTVTLEVTPEHAQKLRLASDLGALSLTLRRSASLDITPDLVITEKTLKSGATQPKVNRYRAPKRAAPVAKAPVQETDQVAKVTIIRSGQKSEVAVLRDTETSGASPAPAMPDTLDLVGAPVTPAPSEEG